MRDSITYACRKLKITRKKPTRYREQDPEKVAAYEAAVKEIAMDKRVYVDEAGFDSYLLREYARAPKGQKIYEKIKVENIRGQAL